MFSTANGAATPGNCSPQGGGLIGGFSSGGLIRSGAYDEFGIFAQYKF